MQWVKDWAARRAQFLATWLSLGHGSPGWPPLPTRSDPMSMRRLFHAVSAQRHAAPAPRVTSGVVGEEQRAADAFAAFHVREILVAGELGERLRDGKQQRLG